MGSSSAIPAYGRRPSAQVVIYNHRLLLVDCGEGAQLQLNRYKFRLRRLDAIFISHLHGDHVYGLPGLLCTLSMTGRTKPLPLIGPQGLRDYVEHQLAATFAEVKYELQFFEQPHPFNGPQQVFEAPQLTVTTLPLEHRIPCVGFRFNEKPRKRRFLVKRAYELGVPKEYFHLLKLGNDVHLPDGRTVPADECLGDPDPAFSYAYCSDTCYTPALTPYIQDVSLLYHEATFLDNMALQAHQTAHSTAREAAQQARDCGAGRLIIGHYSARYKDLTPLLDEAQSVFPATQLGVEGCFYPVYPDAPQTPPHIGELDDDDHDADNDA